MSVKQTKKQIASLVVNCRSQKISIKKFFEVIEVQQSHYTDFSYSGNGAFSFVLKATNQKTGQIIALKVTECDDNDINGMKQVEEEYRLLRQFSNCKYIVQVFNCFFLTEEESSDDDCSNDDEEEGKNEKKEKNLFFVVEQEFCQTNLENFFTQCRLKKSYPCQQQKEVMAIQMLDSVAYLHRFDLLHRDIKPSNFLLSLDEKEIPTVKICDLSFASALKNNKSRITVSKIKGTQAYFAPEVEKGVYKKGSDVFSLGLVLLELDNMSNFNFNDTTNEDKLEIKFAKIFPNYQIDRQSYIYKIAYQCLNYFVENRKQAIDLLIQFIQENQNYLAVELSSVINRKSEQLSQIQKTIIEKQQKKKSEILELSQSSKNQKHFKNLIQMFDVLQQKPFKAQEYETILKLLQSIFKYDSNFEFISVGAKGLVLGTFNKTLGIKTVLKIQQVQSKHEVVQEVGIMRDCQMPLVIKFYGYFYLSVNKQDDFVVYEIEKCSGNTQKINKQIFYHQFYFNYVKVQFIIYYLKVTQNNI
ncbi:kinase domain protein (macronuclear) [Tetrahymena thermophila SB210]|uniref:Kinase domain protein n=1 Tax=Tetrahymena thermophila (strain SB210) TaxID=312017 RepID=W7XH79_TETTS|nr:kinase domain protein [Tetrahymena thermophila SB210]EWS76538.1 kinase domain protein [Tetrahymena thermophila SB210]|eukprot:XP_012650910.1 kinase domain protein [Tetrahymena thermophila SB210]